MEKKTTFKNFKNLKYHLGLIAKAAYSLGAWAVAYLINRVNNQDILTDTFHPNLKELGFEGAFDLAFGFSSEEFFE